MLALEEAVSLFALFSFLHFWAKYKGSVLVFDNEEMNNRKNKKGGTAGASSFHESHT